MRIEWHTWHTALLLAAASLGGCGGRAENDSAGAPNLASCESDADCPSGECIDRQCTTATSPRNDAGAVGAGASAGIPASGAGGTGAGGAPSPSYGGTAGTALPGCGGAFVFTPDAVPATGGAAPIPPTCAVDAQGFAATSFEALCDAYRCAQAADLVAGLDCSENVVADVEGVTLTTGCGFETVKISGAGFTYEASFDTTQAELTALRVQAESLQSLGGCTAYGFMAGEARPTCASEVRHHCVRPADPEGSLVCREPGQEGCAACCTPWSTGDQSGCTVATSSGAAKRYDTYWGENTACACNCPPCAECTTELEYQLRVQPEKPECNCPPAGTGGVSGTGGVPSTGGTGGSPCEIYCSGLNPLLRACPDVPR